MKKKLATIFALVLCLAMALSMTACFEWDYEVDGEPFEIPETYNGLSNEIQAVTPGSGTLSGETASVAGGSYSAAGTAASASASGSNAKSSSSAASSSSASFPMTNTSGKSTLTLNANGTFTGSGTVTLNLASYKQKMIDAGMSKYADMLEGSLNIIVKTTGNYTAKGGSVSLSGVKMVLSVSSSEKEGLNTLVKFIVKEFVDGQELTPTCSASVSGGKLTVKIAGNNGEMDWTVGTHTFSAAQTSAILGK